MTNIFNKALTFINLRKSESDDDNCLFDGDDELFKKTLTNTYLIEKISVC